MTEWSMDLTSFDLDSVVPGEDDLLLSLGAGPSDQGSSSASELGDYELVYLQNMYPSDLSAAADVPGGAEKKTDAVVVSDDGLMAFSCGNPNSPADDSALASSISTPAHQSPVRSNDEPSPVPLPSMITISSKTGMALMKEKNDRKRKADAKDSGEESSVHSGSVSSPPGEQDLDDDISASRLKPEDDPLGLFSRDPHTLTAEELKQLKKQKRLIKNRESAQLSRHRKKLHQETLESQVMNLEKEKHILNARLEQLALENAILKNQLLAHGKVPLSASMTGGLFDAMKPNKGTVALALIFTSALFFTNVDLYPNENLRALAPMPIQNGAVVTASLTGGRRGRVLLSTSSSEDFRPAEPLLADKKQLLIVTLLDHLVSQLKAPSSLFVRLCVRLTQMGVLDGCEFVDSMAAVRQEYLEAFRAFNNEFSKGDEKAANAQLDAEFVFARHPPQPKQIDPAPFAVPLPPAVPPLGARDTVVDEENARLLKRIRGQLSGDVNVLCPSAQLLISDVPANPEPGGGVGARLTRLQRVVAAGRVGNVSEQKDPQESDGESGRSGNSTLESDGELPVIGVGVGHGGALSMVLPRRIFDATRIAGRLPAIETNLLELRCSAYDLNPLGFPSLVGAS